MGVDVRDAEASDIDWIVGQIKLFDDFSPSKRSLFQGEDHMAALVADAIENHLFLVATVDGELAGFISGYIHPHPFNPEIKTLNETLWWACPEYRSAKVGSLLLDEFNKYGEENCDWMLMSLEANSPIDDRCLLSRGYKLHEKNYLKEM